MHNPTLDYDIEKATEDGTEDGWNNTPTRKPSWHCPEPIRTAYRDAYLAAAHERAQSDVDA